MIDPLDGLECGACGGVAIRPDLDGTYPHGIWNCLECSAPGFVTSDSDDEWLWVTDESEEP